MIRVLQVFGRMDRGGAETMIMNLYRNIDRDSVQFDFVVHTKDICDYDEEIKSLGGRIYSVPKFNGKNIFRYINSWKKLLKEHPEWKIIHAHMRSTASIYLPIAKRMDRFTIIHSHSISSGKGLQAKIKDVIQLPLRFLADYYFACSKKAGEWLFGKRVCSHENFLIVPNAIDVRQYSFDENVREEIREDLSLTDKKIIGHVGRFEYPKNHEFLLKVFESIVKEDDNYHLVLVGEGSLKAKIQELAKSMNIINNISFLGLRTDVNCVLQAFDFMIFPSFYEGFPVTLVETQATGLPILASSEAIEKEYNITNSLFRLSLNDSIDEWKKTVLDNINSNVDRKGCANMVLEAGFDIDKNAKQLEAFYKSHI